MRYYLWDIDISTLLGRYQREEDAYEMVRTLIEHYGNDYAECLSLGREKPTERRLSQYLVKSC